MIVTRSNVPWTRKHDLPGTPHFSSVSKIVYPTSLEQLIELCSTRPAGERFRAAGSHWGLSDAAISDHTFIETHDPNNVETAMGKTLYEVVPGCLTSEYMELLSIRSPAPFDKNVENVVGIDDEITDIYPVHVESGKRLYQLYSELDFGDEKVKQSLAVAIAKATGNTSYYGPWALATMGGAAGQTVYGALTTGTHGANFRIPPMADIVMAMHLVADGGKHYWIEPGKQARGVQMTDDTKLNALYGVSKYGGASNFQIIRDDDVFNAVLMAAGRFGIVYSFVLGAVRQYSLHLERRLLIWEDIKDNIRDLTSNLYSSKFLQVAVSVTPHDNFTKHLCGVTKQWNVPLAGPVGSPWGRKQRRGKIQPYNPRIGSVEFARAGKEFPYTQDPANPDALTAPSLLEIACANSNFIDGIIQAVIDEVHKFLDSHGAVVGTGIAGAAVAVGGTAGLLALASALLFILAILAAILHALQNAGANRPRLGQTLEEVKDKLLNHTDPDKQAAGLFVWHMIAFRLFSSQQGDLDTECISYAMLDGHNYKDKSCNVNVDSIEVFFDTTDSRLVAFVDQLLNFEAQQEFEGKAMVGYISLRFMRKTRAIIGPQQHEHSCAIEIAGLKDVDGTVDLINRAIFLGLHPMFSGIMHWGQRNESTMQDIQHRFGDRIGGPAGNLGKWRHVLSAFTENGRLDGFSSEHTRKLGLEVVQPVIATLDYMPAPGRQGHPFTVKWDASKNPPGTQLELWLSSPSGRLTRRALPRLKGDMSFTSFETGIHYVTVYAFFTLNGETRRDVKKLTVKII